MIVAYLCVCKIQKTLQSKVYTTVSNFRNLYLSEIYTCPHLQEWGKNCLILLIP